ncbi:uncharacterized protein YifE (UPF0438 family) [Bacteroides reticulotermitis]|uniref:Uncharacterized protein YifE (UPF0438 family) n=1 Tax=Bacteroides reticulotermitis TaxID=1133319 RepID=A0A840D2L5_9BACE|nr:uncharacterized protein YifE (UPF0438 family) [Bacteroides reticulotermitis]
MDGVIMVYCKITQSDYMKLMCIIGWHREFSFTTSEIRLLSEMGIPVLSKRLYNSEKVRDYIKKYLSFVIAKRNKTLRLDRSWRRMKIAIRKSNSGEAT